MTEDKQVVIKRLDLTVVNRIAAGEVIQRPANAIKEMVENSLDAGSTSITITIKSGGLKYLQISDNGHGIRKEDMDIVCERFTTSKLKEFDDLKSIATFGFRGEALASISHVAHLTISTKTKSSQCAYKASYMDGKLKAQPKPSAGNQGTQITVEDLFYNVPTRRKAFKSAAEEHQKIADVITKYSIHNSGISFTLRKGDSEYGQTGGISVRTQVGATVLNNISNIYGQKIANDLIELKHDDKRLHLKVNGYVSNANCSNKRFDFLLFINNRLVECTALKRALDSVYQTYLPKGGKPFVYMSLEMSPSNLDVNVHPTKHEVHFLHEDEIIESVQKAVEQTLLSCDTSRTFYTQKLLPTSSLNQETEKKTSSPSTSKVYDHHLVRTDSKLQKLDAFMMNTPSIANKENIGKKDLKQKGNLTAGQLPRRRRIRLTSILNLQEKFKDAASENIEPLIRDYTFVGCVDPELALIQHSTKLYLANTTKLSQQLFYQISLNDFGNFGMYELSEPAPIYDLALLGLEFKESGWQPHDGSKEQLAEYVTNFLMEKAEMLEDYFSLQVKDKNVTGIPILLKNYIPPLEGLPMLVLRLATEVNWDEEEMCFHSFCSELARFNSIRKGYSNCDDIVATKQSQEDIDQTVENADNNTTPWKWNVEHVIFPAFRDLLTPTLDLEKDGTFLQLANLPDLYKVFERC